MIPQCAGIVCHPTQRSNDENFGSIYLCIQFATEENKTHPWLYCKQHTQKKFGCFQDRNEENNNNAILKSGMKGGFFLENFPLEALYQNAKGNWPWPIS